MNCSLRCLATLLLAVVATKVDVSNQKKASNSSVDAKTTMKSFSFQVMSMEAEDKKTIMPVGVKETEQKTEAGVEVESVVEKAAPVSLAAAPVSMAAAEKSKPKDESKTAAEKANQQTEVMAREETDAKADKPKIKILGGRGAKREKSGAAEIGCFGLFVSAAAFVMA
eukprot:TRINITY_DN13339_c0_g1_i1.p1 TRINITY_DN13339_c0_g1~~TRINITY_DN13339_c0_g1_i1.p1  ORF type:complete len:191 (-),score=49.28 TRINITY_DN13339_c0_g1_i1:66-569(-)